MKINNKGFTLVELLATIILLALVASIGTYSITSIIRSSKEKNYDLLILNIKDAVNTYSMECSNSDIVPCNNTVTLEFLVKYGYLTSNSSNKDGKVINPKNDDDITNCSYKINYNNSASGVCPAIDLR